MDDSSFVDHVYDEDNMCRLRTVTRTEFTLPEAMTVVKIEDEEYFTPDSRDSCCRAFADGNVSLQEACIVYILDTTSDIIFDDIERTCTMVTNNEVLFRLPSDRLTTVTTGNIIESNEASIDQCFQNFPVRYIEVQS